jgi:hypothetical protein
VKPRVFGIVAIALAAAACSSLPPVLVQLEMPGVPVFPPGLFSELIVTEFRDDAPSPDFALGLELQAYFAAEFGRSFKGKVSHVALSRDGQAAAGDPAFWKQAGAGRGQAVFLTGSAGLVGLTRKALGRREIPVDGPFNVERRGLIEQRRWTLSVDLFVVSAVTGEVLYQRNFREERDYIELDKPADFAFAELADRIRARLLPVLFGAPTVEERTLLRR